MEELPILIEVVQLGRTIEGSEIRRCGIDYSLVKLMLARCVDATVPLLSLVSAGHGRPYSR